MEENKENAEKAQEMLNETIEDINDPHRRKLWYSENYRKRYEEKYGNKEKIKQPEQNKIISEIEKEAVKVEKEIVNYIEEPKHIRILKILAILIPIIIILYLVYANFIVNKDFNYFYDIGSLSDSKTPYLTPISRVSDIQNDSISYRNLTSGLVYFTVNLPRGSESLSIESRFKDTFPNNSAISLGAKDKAEWHYIYKPIFYSSLSNLYNLYKIDNIYLLNEELDLLPVEELLNQEGIVIASDSEISPIPNKIEDWQGNTIINTSLRGGHTFYIYISGNLNLSVKKQDINWYNNSDELNIYLYDSDENLIANTTIPDDGITDIKSKQTAEIQQGNLQASNLKEGVYKLVFTDFDGLIREIKINTKRIVATSVFLADSQVYHIETKKSKVYTELIKDSEIKFLTYHQEGIQNLTYDNLTFNFYQEDSPLYLSLKKGNHTFEIPKNDLIVSYPGYLSFSKESYFEPFKQRIIKPEYSLEWLRNNADYFISDYNSPTEDNNWQISQTEFNIKEDNLFTSNNQISMLFNIPHLSQEGNLNYTIPIDWINITVHKPGLFEKWSGK